MGRTGHFFVALFAGFGVAAAAPRCLAGIIHVTADPNTAFHVATTDPPTPATTTDGTTDAGGQGTINLGTPAEEAAIGRVWVVKVVDKKFSTQRVRLNPDGTTLGSLEPFRYPTFEGIDLLFAITNVNAPQGVDFTPGQVLTVTNGNVAETDLLHFKDGTSFGSVGFPTDAQLDAFPNYTGTVTFYAYDFVTPVPEPSSLLTAAGAMGGTLVVARRSKPKLRLADRRP